MVLTKKKNQKLKHESNYIIPHLITKTVSAENTIENH